MSALYAFARRVDDIGDGAALGRGEAGRARRRSAASSRARCGSRRATSDPVLVALGDTARALPDPGRGARGARHRLRDGLSPAALRDLRGARRLLPLRRRVDRPALARVFGSTEPERAPALADTLGIAPAAHEHPPRHRRGPRRDGPGLPPRGGPRALRLHRGRAGARPSRSSTSSASRPARAERALRRGPRSCSACSTAARGPASAAMAGIYRRLLDRIEADPLAVLERRVSLPTWEKAWVAARSLAGVQAHEIERAPQVVVVGGGLAGLAAALGCADGGARVTLLEGRPRLGGATWSFERNGPRIRQRPARLPPLLHRLPAVPRAPRDRRRTPRSRTGSRSRCSQPAPRAARRRRLAGSGVAGCPRRSTSPGRSLAYRHLGLRRPAAGSGAALVALRRLRLSDPALDGETFGGLPRPPRPARGGDRRAVGPHHAADGERPCRRGLARPRGQGLQDRAARASPTPPTSAGRRCRSASCTATPPCALARGAARGPPIRSKADGRAARRPTPAGRLAGRGRRRRAGRGRRRRARRPPRGGRRARCPPVPAIDPARLAGLGSSPIVDVHVVYDRQVLDHELAAAARLPGPVRLRHDRCRRARPRGRASASRSRSRAPTTSTASARRCSSSATPRRSRALFPAAARRPVLDAVVTREHAATFRGVPGTARLRPGPATGCRASSSPERGPTPVGRRRWRARCAAARRGVGSALRAVGSSRAVRGPSVDSRRWWRDSDPERAGDPAAGPGRWSRRALRAAVDRLTPELRPLAEYHLGWADADGRPTGGDGGKGDPPGARRPLGRGGRGPGAASACPERSRSSSSTTSRSSTTTSSTATPSAATARRCGRSSASAGRSSSATRSWRSPSRSCSSPSWSRRSGDGHGPVETAGAARAVADATAAMIAGQALDMAFESVPVVDVDGLPGDGGGQDRRAARVRRRRSGRCSPAPPRRRVAALDRFGVELGLAFQAVDDLLGIWGDPATTGKPAWSDLRQHKKTLPVAAALAAGRPRRRGARCAARGRAPRGATRWPGPPQLVEACGGRGAAAEEADRRLALALARPRRRRLVEPAARRARRARPLRRRAGVLMATTARRDRERVRAAVGAPTDRRRDARRGRRATCSACSRPRAGGRASSRRTSRWTPRT